ncbi:putative methyltransferase DDB_G0268948 [Dreissena polymorpha]|uniref:Methyltransferase type 11 domain-containing protein n=1 Tax=Dreissena polymorpha TaxID=45954 RepID=A0A9D4N0Q4_DREPO|nr:putative methyltransferase DDB_G0268948 [Dreissena polymorpha]KAH3884607.1 hypothetical protein DPMN_008590 [Dreissena polymorpha]
MITQMRSGVTVLTGRDLFRFSIFCVRTMAIRLFEEKDHAQLYSKYRPTYPDSVYETIMRFYGHGKEDAGDYTLAVDVGCGNGQSSFPLVKHFSRVIGCDVSKEQIKSAVKHEKLTYTVCSGENLSFLQDGSVDLLTIAQALHWLDRETFFKEVIRVLKPGGVFAGYGYGNNILNNEDANNIVKKFYSFTLGKYWDKQRSHIDNMYMDIKLPFHEQQRIEDERVSIRRTMPVDAYIGYVSTWSAWQSLLRAIPGSTELGKVQEGLKEIYMDREMSIYWPGFLLLGRR